MAITDFGPIFYPYPNSMNASFVYAFDGNLQIDAANSKMAWVFRVPKTGTLNRVEFYIGFVASVQDVKVSFQDVGATGYPDGTADQFRVIPLASVVVGWAVTGLMTSDGTDGGVKRSVTVNDLISVVIEWNSTVGGSVWIYGVSNGGNPWFPRQYYAYDPGTGTWAKGAGLGISPTITLQYDDGTYGLLGYNNMPMSALGITTFNSASTPDERGIRFVPPVDIRVRGMYWYGGISGNANVVLYDSADTILVNETIDTDYSADNGTNIQNVPFAPTTLTGGDTYRLTLLPGASNATIGTYNINSAAIIDTLSQANLEMYSTTRTNAGAWTDSTTSGHFMGLVVDGVETAGGGGGGASSYGFA